MWNYYKVQPNNPLPSNSETFNYKTSITGNTYNLVDSEAGYDATKAGKNETKIAFSLKHLSNFWRTLSLELSLIWSKSCALADMTVRPAGNNHKPPAIVAAGRLEFSNNRHKIICSSCYFVNRKWQETFRTIKIRI